MPFYVVLILSVLLPWLQAGEGDASQVDTSAGIPEQVRTVIQGNKSMTGLSVTEIKAALPHVTADEIT